MPVLGIHTRRQIARKPGTINRLKKDQDNRIRDKRRRSATKKEMLCKKTEPKKKKTSCKLGAKVGRLEEDILFVV